MKRAWINWRARRAWAAQKTAYVLRSRAITPADWINRHLNHHRTFYEMMRIGKLMQMHSHNLDI